MEETVTISLKRYKELESKEEAIKKRKTFLSQHDYRHHRTEYLYYLDDEQCNELLFGKIKDLEEDKRKLQEENKKHLDAQYEVLKEKIKQQYTPKPWWKIFNRD
jgi:hypothetical protein